MAQHLPGIGKLKVTNMAVSGTSTSYWATQIASIDCSQYDRVLVMLGINNNQATAQTGLSAFLSNMVTINAKIVADGSRPIWGMNTRYTTAELSGNGGVTTNHGIFARYNAVVKDKCATDGYALAETIETFGNNAGSNGSFTGDISPSWHTDNLHPNGYGQIAIASAFASALSRDISDKYRIPRLRAGTLTPAAPWAVNVPLTNGYLRWAIRDGVLYLRGKVRRDPASSAPVANTTIATLPSFISISAQADFIVRTQGAGVNSQCELTINQNGTIVAGPNSLPDMIDISVSMLL
jgi:lysophospholipase L1-like esterase